MSVPTFADGGELFDYLVEKGPKMPPEKIRWLRSGEWADAIHDYLMEASWVASDLLFEELMGVVRANIQLVSGYESDIELADYVGAPWDCFAEG